MLKPIHLLRHHGTNKQEKYPRNLAAIVNSTTYNKHNTRHDQHQRGLVSAGHMVAGCRGYQLWISPLFLLFCYAAAAAPVNIKISRIPSWRICG